MVTHLELHSFRDETWNGSKNIYKKLYSKEEEYSNVAWYENSSH